MTTKKIKEKNIRLSPVDVKPHYTTEELDKIDYIVEKEKHDGKTVKPGKEFIKQIKIHTER